MKIKWGRFPTCLVRWTHYYEALWGRMAEVAEKLD